MMCMFTQFNSSYTIMTTGWVIPFETISQPSDSNLTYISNLVRTMHFKERDLQKTDSYTIFLP